MLDTLRANSRSILTYVLFGIIIVVFVVSFGPGSRGCSSGPGATESWAAKVNGRAVAPADFEQQYGQLARMYQQQGGGELDALFRTRLRQMALDQVVQRELVEQEAHHQGIAVSDEELNAAVHAIPAFQSVGRFDLELYKRAVANAYGTTGAFEERLRKDLVYSRMMALLRSSARVTEDEVRDAYLADNDRVTLELARFPYAAARQEVVPTDAQVKDFIARNGPRIEAFYKDNPGRFDQKKRVRARHILVKADDPAGAGAAKGDVAKARIDALAARVKKGEDFAKVASEASDDPGSRERGGDLGFFSAGVMAKAFEDAAMKMKPGEVSEPVRTQFGWHLIKVEEVKEPEQITLDKARPEIARELLQEELGKGLAVSRAAAVLAKVRAGASFADALPEARGAKVRGKAPVEPVKLGGEVVRPEDTGSFNASSSPSVPRVGPAPELFADALKASAGQVLGRVYETSTGAVVARVKERQRPDPAALPASRGEFETRLRMRREGEIERAWMDDLRKRAKVDLNQALVRGETRASPYEGD